MVCAGRLTAANATTASAMGNLMRGIVTGVPDEMPSAWCQCQGLSRHELDGRVATTWRSEAADVFLRGLGVELLRVGIVNRIANSFALHAHGADAEHAVADLDHTERVVEKG